MNTKISMTGVCSNEEKNRKNEKTQRNISPSEKIKKGETMKNTVSFFSQKKKGDSKNGDNSKKMFFLKKKKMMSKETITRAVITSKRISKKQIHSKKTIKWEKKRKNIYSRKRTKKGESSKTPENKNKIGFFFCKERQTDRAYLQKQISL